MDGMGSYLEIFKTLVFLGDYKNPKLPINLLLPITVAGHSTGGRAAL